MTDFLKYKVDNENPDEKKRFIKNLFNSISPTYDILNHILSFGMDFYWRRKAVKLISGKNSAIIDLCCGTGDISNLLFRSGANVTSMDFSLNMIRKGIRKKSLQGNNIAGDVTRIPFKENTFHGAAIAFGIRNIPDIDIFMKEVNRILKPGGRFIILELVRPKSIIINKLHTMYLKILLPVVGGLVSGRFRAYKYLSGTVRTFINPQGIIELLKKHNFSRITHVYLSFGIAAIIAGEKEQ